MICKKCSKEVEDSKVYCPNCRTLLKTDPIFPIIDNSNDENKNEFLNKEEQKILTNEEKIPTLEETPAITDEITENTSSEQNVIKDLTEETSEITQENKKEEDNENLEKPIETTVNENNETLKEATTENSNTDECPDCGQRISANEKFCPKCGRKLTSYEDANTQKISFTFTKKNLFIIVGIILVLIIIIAIIPSLSKEVNKPDFENIYENVCENSYCDLASDGTYLEVDTNPYNRDDYYNYTAANIPKKINEELGLPASLYSKMINTRALDGAQTATYGNISVRWTYHPDQGLEILYEYNYN